METINNYLYGMINYITQFIKEPPPPKKVKSSLEEFYDAINSNPNIISASNLGYDFSDGTSMY